MKPNQTTAVLYDPQIKTNLISMLNERPVCLLQVGDKPLIAYWCEYCVQQGIKQLVVYVYKQSHIVREFVGGGRRWGDLEISVCHSAKPMSAQQALTNSVNYPNKVVLAKTNCLPEIKSSQRPFFIDDLKALWLANMTWLEQGQTHRAHLVASQDISVNGNNYIGRHCKLLPQTKLDSVVIEQECFIDAHCDIANSVITRGTIVGGCLKLNSTIVDGKLLYRADLDLVTWINDPRILASKLNSINNNHSPSLITQKLKTLGQDIINKFVKPHLITK